jgi:hypothetical protein
LAVPSAALSNGASGQPEPLADLDRAMARAVAGKLAETLLRYVQPALLPLVVEEMRQVLDIDQPDAVASGDQRDAPESGSTRGDPFGAIPPENAR